MMSMVSFMVFSFSASCCIFCSFFWFMIFKLSSSLVRLRMSFYFDLIFLDRSFISCYFLLISLLNASIFLSLALVVFFTAFSSSEYLVFDVWTSFCNYARFDSSCWFSVLSFMTSCWILLNVCSFAFMNSFLSANYARICEIYMSVSWSLFSRCSMEAIFWVISSCRAAISAFTRDN